MEHSKLPWKQSKNIVLSDFFPGYIARCIVNGKDHETASANADFIVTACNEYEKLKAENAQLKTDNEYHIETIRVCHEGIDGLKALLSEAITALKGVQPIIEHKNCKQVDKVLVKAKEISNDQ